MIQNRPPEKRTPLCRALSKLGLCSRTQAVSQIREGRVLVNSRRVTDPLAWVTLGRDTVVLSDGQGQPPASRDRICLMMHKPRGYVTTRSDEQGKPTVYDLLPAKYRQHWIFPVGRLDLDSEGLLLFTNDSSLATRLTDPASNLRKIYRVQLDRLPREEELQPLRAGVVLDGQRTRPAEISREKGQWFRVTITEGKNRQIRRIFRTIRCRVRRLVRVAIGRLELGDLSSGEVRLLPPGECDTI